jgi:hypothetical protein
MRHGWLLAIVAGSLAMGCQAREPVAVPRQLHGVWKTQEPKYADTYFELREGDVVLGSEAGRSAPHRVTTVTAEPQEGATFYRITYRNAAEGVDDTLVFYHYPAPGGLIRFKSQQDIAWRKEGAER